MKKNGTKVKINNEYKNLKQRIVKARNKEKR